MNNVLRGEIILGIQYMVFPVHMMQVSGDPRYVCFIGSSWGIILMWRVHFNHWGRVIQGFLFTQIPEHNPSEILKVLNISKLQDNFCILVWILYAFDTPEVKMSCNKFRPAKILWLIYASVNQTSFVQIMACRLAGAKALSEPILEYC